MLLSHHALGTSKKFWERECAKWSDKNRLSKWKHTNRTRIQSTSTTEWILCDVKNNMQAPALSCVVVCQKHSRAFLISRAARSLQSRTAVAALAYISSHVQNYIVIEEDANDLDAVNSANQQFFIKRPKNYACLLRLYIYWNFANC